MANTEEQNLIFGYTWEQIQAMQQGKYQSKPILYSSKPTAKESDIQALNEHGIYGLIKKKYFGILDRLETSELLDNKEHLDCVIRVVEEPLDKEHERFVNKSDLRDLEVVREIIKEKRKECQEKGTEFVGLFSIIRPATDYRMKLLAERYGIFIEWKVCPDNLDKIEYQIYDFACLCTSILCHVLPY